MLITICGIAVVDIIAADLPRVAKPGELIFTPVQTCIGGHACNVSVDLVQIGLPKKEVSVFISVGEDPFGDFMEESLERAGVIAHVYRTKASTSKDLILVVKREDRRFHVDIGANLQHDPAKIRESLKADKPYLFYLGGIGMMDKVDDQLAQICKEAKQLGSLVFADVVSPHGKSWDFVIPAFEWMDVFHCNDLEAKKITGKANLWTAVRTIADSGVKVSLVTKGGHGLVAKVPGAEVEMPAFGVPVVDPTGAGDAFCAGILFQLTRGPYLKILKEKGDISLLAPNHWRELLMYGSACGAACCKAVGTTTSVKPEYIDTLLKEQGREISRLTKVRMVEKQARSSIVT